MTIKYPKWLFTKTPIYHITAIDNLESILNSGYLYSTNHIPCDKVSIANEEVQQKRSTKKVPLPPHGCIHDYVPFYFAPRSPMLYVNHNGYIENARPQEDIVHLVTYAQLIAENTIPFVFYDRHAVVAVAQPYNDLKDLDKIDWDLFFESPPGNGNYALNWHDRHDERNPKWTNRKEVRQAEFLINEKLPWNLIVGIATMTEDKAIIVQDILNRHNKKTSVKVKPEWYYN